jgi:hypothetical protein
MAGPANLVPALSAALPGTSGTGQYVADALAHVPVAVTAATLTILDGTHNDRTVVLDSAAGITVTLPAATGSGLRLKFVTKTTVTSNNHIIQVVGDDTMTGFAQIAKDSADTVDVFETASTSDTITMNGSTKGGIKGDVIYLEDIATDLWSVECFLSGTGTEVTPFSAAVT